MLFLSSGKGTSTRNLYLAPLEVGDEQARWLFLVQLL